MAWVIPLIIVEFEAVTELAFPPEQMTPGTAGYDLKSPREYTIQPESKQLIPLDLKLHIQPGYHGELWSRSGLVARYNVHVGAGLIDQDYTGILCVVLINHNKYMPYLVTRGMRIAQIVFHPTVRAMFIERPNAYTSKRGPGGFGSTGYW